MKKNLFIVLILTFFSYPSFVWGADIQKGHAAVQKGDFAAALREWKPLAEQGNATAQYNLGLMYRKGDGVTQDYKTAVKWYRLSAEQGLAVAQRQLGLMYGIGNGGVIKDNIYAHMWINISALNGYKNADKLREYIAKKMTSADISTAQRLARECVEKKYKGC